MSEREAIFGWGEEVLKLRPLVLLEGAVRSNGFRQVPTEF
jgi:hypothetical protein